jgi:hypothetical protein
MASQLPNGVDARTILKLVGELVENFLTDPEPERERANVVTLVKGEDR